MTRDEMKKGLMVLNASYPNWKIDNLSLTIDTWHRFLGHYDYQTFITAVDAYIMSDKSGFAPTIGKLNDLINNLDEQLGEEILNPMQAWALVSTALRKSSWHSEEAFAELPPLVQKAVGSPNNLHNWATTDIHTVENDIMQSFQITYQSVVKQERENRRLPMNVQQMIAQHQSENLMIGGGEDD